MPEIPDSLIGAGKVVGAAVGALFLLSVLFVALAQTGFLPLFAGEYQTVPIQAGECGNGERVDIEVMVADTFSKKYVGLSRTPSLPSDKGLVFPFENDSTHRIEMRNMDFGLDVVFVGSDGRVNSIESLSKPSSALEITSSMSQ